MATIVNVTKPKYNKSINVPEMQNVNGVGVIPYGGGRTGILLVVYSANGGTVTIKSGNGVFGGSDKEFSVAAGENKHILLEAGPFLQTEGENKGCILLTSSNCMVSAVELD